MDKVPVIPTVLTCFCLERLTAGELENTNDPCEEDAAKAITENEQSS